jgi:capsular polysaccharide transport system permease protein
MNYLLIGLMPLWQRIWSIAMRPMFLRSGVFFFFEATSLP